MLTPIKQCCIYTSISLSIQRLSVSTQYLPFTTTFSWLAKLSCVLIDFSVSTQDFLVSACVKSFFSWGSYFPDKNMFTSSYWFDIVFWNSFQLTICRTKVGLLYKTKLHHDRWGQSNIRADLHTEISKSWHVNFRWCKILLCQKFWWKFSHYLNSHESFDNKCFDFPSLINNYLQPFTFR